MLKMKQTRVDAGQEQVERVQGITLCGSGESGKRHFDDLLDRGRRHHTAQHESLQSARDGREEGKRQDGVHGGEAGNADLREYQSNLGLYGPKGGIHG